jgi:hypothetical protein
VALLVTARLQDKKGVETNRRDSSKPLRFKQRKHKIYKKDQGDDPCDEVWQIHALSSISRSQTLMKPSVRARNSTVSPIKIRSFILPPSDISLCISWSIWGQEESEIGQENINISPLRFLEMPAYLSTT